MSKTNPARLASLIGLTAILAIGAASAAQSTQPAQAERTSQTAPAARPNVVLIVADDLGYGDLGSYGQRQIKTSNLDKLAAQGVRFTQAYSGSPVCGPSRSTLLTGLHTGHTPVRGNPRYAVGWDRDKQGDPPLPSGDGAPPTLGQAFAAAGYDTAVIGKWGLGAPGGPGDPKRHGFGLFFGYANHIEAHNYYPDHLWRDDRREDLPPRTYSADVIAKEALAFVDRDRGGRPFFLYYAPTLPHARLNPPDVVPYAAEDWPQPSKAYAAMVTRLDASVGALMDALDRRGLAENTLVVFTSDNGPAAAGRHEVERFDSNGPLRGRKTFVYEGGIRVPMIARWPGRTPAGAVVETPVAFWDVLPTACDLLGRPAPAATDGASLLPLLTGRAKAVDRPSPLYWEFVERTGQQAVRLGDWKGVRNAVSVEAAPKLELYDLKVDPAEARDVAAEHPDVVARIERVMAEQRTTSKWWPLTKPEVDQAGGPKAGGGTGGDD